MTFFEDKAADFAIGSVCHGIDNVCFSGGSFEPDEFSSRYESVTVRDFRRDIFGNETVTQQYSEIMLPSSSYTTY